MIISIVLPTLLLAFRRAPFALLRATPFGFSRSTSRGLRGWKWFGQRIAIIDTVDDANTCINPIPIKACLEIRYDRRI